MNNLWSRLRRLESKAVSRPPEPTPEALRCVTQAFLAKVNGGKVSGSDFEARAAGIVKRHRAGVATAEDAEFLAALPADDLTLASYDAISFVELVNGISEASKSWRALRSAGRSRRRPRPEGSAQRAKLCCLGLLSFLLAAQLWMHHLPS